MTRKELINSRAYHVTSASTEYWRQHKDEVEEDNGQICDAFEAGADFQNHMDADRAVEWVLKEMHGMCSSGFLERLRKYIED